MTASDMPIHEDVMPMQPQGDAVPDDFYKNLQPPPDMDDLDNCAMPDEMAQLATEAPAEQEEEHHGMRRPTIDEFETLRDHPYVQRVAAVFHTSIVDARLKQ